MAIRPLEIPDNAERYELMYYLFGRGYGPCRFCRHHKQFIRNNRRIYKCAVYGVDDNQTTWALNVNKCGCFNKPWGEKPILQLIYEGTLYRRNPKPEDKVKPKFLDIGEAIK